MPIVEGLLEEERNDLRREGDPSGIFMPENEGLGQLSLLWGLS